MTARLAPRSPVAFALPRTLTERRVEATLRRDMRSAAVAAGATMSVVFLLDAIGQREYGLRSLLPNLVGSILVAIALVALRGPARRRPHAIGALIGLVGVASAVEPIVDSPELRSLMLAYFALLVVSMAVFMPWNERWHRTWVGTALASLLLVALTPQVAEAGPAFIEHLLVIGVAASIVSIAGHAVLHRRRLRAFATEQQLRGLHRRRELDQLELRRLNTELLAVSRADPLTRVGNRLRFEEDMRLVLGRLTSDGGIGVLGFLDVDHFKRYNDGLGHMAGDTVLRAIADAIARTLRPGDGIYRFGGEEFLVLLPGVRAQDGPGAVDRIRLAVEAMAIPHPTSERWGIVTVSAGATVLDPSTGPDDWLKIADGALYEAKAGGRNRTEFRLSATA